MVGVTVLVIARNEESNIRCCLESLKWADEIVLVDAESEDGTTNIAREYTQRDYSHPWEGFLGQRNWAPKQAHHR